jgi:hypothetical protein
MQVRVLPGALEKAPLMRGFLLPETSARPLAVEHARHGLAGGPVTSAISSIE